MNICLKHKDVFLILILFFVKFDISTYNKILKYTLRKKLSSGKNSRGKKVQDHNN